MTAARPPRVRRAYLGLGSNLGDRLARLQRAVDELALVPDLDLAAVSPVYETVPVGGPPQPPYLNAVVAVDTVVSPRRLLEVAHALEASGERTRGERWGPRTLDVDVLLVGTETVDEPDLVVPHPRLAERAFVLVPLSDLAPEWAVRIGADRADVAPTGLALTVPE